MNSTDLPNDVEALKAELLERLAQIQSQQTTLAQQQTTLVEQQTEIRSLNEQIEERDARLERMKLELERLKRIQFGRSSEKIDARIAQLELAIGSLEAEEAKAIGADKPRRPAKPQRSLQEPIPEHLPREIITHDNECACPDCGGRLDYLGEDVTEILDYVPASFTVKRHVRPKHRCRGCQSIVQAPAIDRPVPRSRAGAGLLAQVLTAKYADHLPLYRQTGIYAREGVPLSRSTLADWVGASAKLLRPLGDALFRYVMAGTTVHGDDTTVPVLSPGRGKTRTGRLWAYARDERPAGGTTPPAVAFRFSPDRKGKHPNQHLAGFAGTLHADGFAGFNNLYRTGRIHEAACWAHVRRKFHDIWQTNHSPTAKEALDRIGALYAIEETIRGERPDVRRAERQARAGPLLEAMKHWLDELLTQVSAKSRLGEAIAYARNRWDALLRYRDHGEVEIDNNAAERAIRSVALGRKNYLFAGSDAGGESAAMVYSLIGTAKLNGLDPFRYLHAVIERINDHPVNAVDQLLPWNIDLADGQAD